MGLGCLVPPPHHAQPHEADAEQGKGAGFQDIIGYTGVPVLEVIQFNTATEIAKLDC